VASPAIPLWLLPTRWIQPIDDGLRITDIPPDSTITLEGSIRGLIMQDVPRPETAQNLCVTDTVSLIARRQDICTELNPVTVEKTITIQYPLQLELVNCPAWIAPKSTSSISWKVLTPLYFTNLRSPISAVNLFLVPLRAHLLSVIQPQRLPSRNIPSVQ